MRLYISGLMFYFLLLLYLPLVLLGLWWLARRLRHRWLPGRPGVRRALVAGYLLAAVLVPLGDVFYTSWQMARLCPEAGLHVYRSVEVEGFYSELPWTKDVMDEGYQYVEFRYGGQVHKFLRRGNKIETEQLSAQGERYEPKSQYWMTDEDIVVAPNISATEFAVLDSGTRECLGRSVSYRAYPGWVDRLLLQMFDPPTWPCSSGTLSQSELRAAVLIPRGVRMGK
jgi:hypothetical protein